MSSFDPASGAMTIAVPKLTSVEGALVNGAANWKAWLRAIVSYIGYHHVTLAGIFTEQGMRKVPTVEKPPTVDEINELLRAETAERVAAASALRPRRAATASSSSSTALPESSSDDLQPAFVPSSDPRIPDTYLARGTDLPSKYRGESVSLATHFYKTAVTKASTLEETMAEELIKAYASYHSTLDAPVINALEKRADYKVVNDRFLLLELHEMVSEMFDPAKVNNNEEQQREAKRQYEEVTMYPYETIDEFERRFNDLREVSIAVAKVGSIDLFNADLFLERIRVRYSLAVDAARSRVLMRDIPQITDQKTACGLIKEYSKDARLKPTPLKPRPDSNPVSRHVHVTTGAPEASQRERPRGRACAHCGGPHWDRECPKYLEFLKTINKAGGKAFTTHGRAVAVEAPKVLAAVAAGKATQEAIDSGADLSKVVLLDNQANVSLFGNKAVLRNIRELESPMFVSGIGEDEVLVTLCGDLPGIGEVMYRPHCPTNVLSWSHMELSGHLQPDYVRGQHGEFGHFTLTTPFNCFRFEHLDGLFACPMSVVASACGRAPKGHAFMTSVTEREKLYTKREVKNAIGAGEVMKRLAYPTSDELKDIINMGVVADIPSTVQDVARRDFIYGKDVGNLKGKTVRKQPPVTTFEFVPKPVFATQRLFGDIMFVESVPFLVTVSSPLELVMATYLSDGRTTKSIVHAVIEQIAAYQSKGFSVETIVFDNEGGLVAASAALNALGVNMEIAAPGAHVGKIERKLRCLKERMRSVISMLKFTLPISLLPLLVLYCVHRMNMGVARQQMDSASSPMEKFLGRKISYKRELRVGFGDYVQVHDEDSMNNSMRQRTQGAIAVGPVGNAAGAERFYTLRLSGKNAIIRRQHFTVLPVPPTVIEYMNNLAASQRRQLSPDPVFHIGDRVLPADDPADAAAAEGDHMPDVNGPLRAEGVYDEAVAADPVVGVPYEHELAWDEPVVGDEPLAAPVPTAVADDAAATQEEIIDPAVEVPEEPAAPADLPPPASVPAPVAVLSGVTDAAAAVIAMPPSAQVAPPPVTNPGVQEPDPVPAPHYNLRERRGRVFKLSVTKAIQQFGPPARDSIMAELRQFPERGVFVPVHARHLSPVAAREVIRSSMFLKEKFDAAGNFEKLKARLVAGGDMQDPSDYEDISSPTASTSSIFILAALAGAEKRHVYTVDIASAYLNADMGTATTVHMRLDKTVAAMLCEAVPAYTEFLEPKGSMVVRLQKALYGCIQSAKLWYDHLSATLVADGFVPNPYDPCVLTKTVDGVQIAVGFHVDDLFITSVSDHLCQEFLTMLRKRYKTITVHEGCVHSYLGMRFEFADEGRVKVTMDGYIADVLSDCEVTRGQKTPAGADLFEIDPDSPLLSESASAEFHSRTARLLYLGKKVRPDILLPVNFLNTRTQKATEQDMAKLDRVLRYLFDTRDMGMVLEIDQGVAALGYIDASYGVHQDCKSHTGAVISLGKGPIFVKSSKQKIVSRSSTEAELIALSDMSSQLIWTRSFLLALGYTPPPATAYQDNQSTMALANKGRSTSERTRHVDIRYFWIKDRIDSGDIVVEYLPTEAMIADLLTKPLQGDLFVRLRFLLLNWF
jgi:hypothetical protein